jgi:hypothetical protein
MKINKTDLKIIVALSTLSQLGVISLDLESENNFKLKSFYLNYRLNTRKNIPQISPIN